VGRISELAVLDRECTLAAGGHRQVVVVTGEPGAGKTWFAQQAAARAGQAGFAVGHGRCWPHGGAPPMWPWPAVLDALPGTGPTGLGEDRTTDRFARFAAVGRRVAEACEHAQVLLVLDDVHRADGGALLLARFLIRTLDRLPLLVLLTRRTEPATAGQEVEQLLEDVQGDATVLPLRRFDLHETTAFLAAHGVGGPDRGLALTLLRVTGGNPLFLARAVTLDDPAPSGLERVEHAIAGAFGRLPPRARRVVAMLAVLGAAARATDVAALTGDGAADVFDALDAAARAGLVEPAPGGEHTFTHELVRQVGLTSLRPAALRSAHARAAALLAGSDDVATALRRARHALAAADRSDEDGTVAVAACRRAAGMLQRGHDYEGAVGLLDRATVLVARRDAAQQAPVLLERADALLACGRLRESREAFDRAADVAARAADPVLLARAFLGLGGVWVHEHRDTVGRERMLSGQRVALAELPAGEHVLRCRLEVRLAAEGVYAGGPLQPVHDALARARASGDDRTLAEALSLAHHAMLAPEHAAARPALAAELVVVAARAGDGVLSLFGLLWRTVDEYLLGDARADRSLAELRERADAVGCRHVLFVVAAIEVQRLIRAGRLAEAERAAGECFRLGSDVGDQDATGFYAGQLLAIRWIEGRDSELLDMVREAAASPTLLAAEFALRASVAMVTARAGRVDEARAALDRLAPAGLAALPTSSTWLVGMAAVVEAARLLGDADTARQAGALLVPFAALPVMPSLAIACLGSVERALGQVAETTGDRDAAVAHFEAALRATLRLGNRPVAAVLRADLAAALDARDAAGDVARAGELLRQAHGEATAMGLTVRAAEWSDQLARHQARADRAERAGGVLLRSKADHWLLVYGRREIALTDLVGMRYLAVLLERPGQDVPALDLAMAATVEHRRDELVDATALRAYRRRLAELDTALDDAALDTGRATAVADPARAERLAAERDALLAHLSGALGLGGRSRTFASSGERARTAVHKALTRALDQIATVDAGLAADLRTCIRTGTTCRYDPDEIFPEWQVDRTS
jgi:tetratricopeptide (TPR) repeat protein